MVVVLLEKWNEVLHIPTEFSRSFALGSRGRSTEDSALVLSDCYHYDIRVSAPG